MRDSNPIRAARNLSFFAMLLVVAVARTDLLATRGCSQFVCADGVGFHGHFCTADDIDGTNNTCVNFRELCQQYCEPYNTSQTDPNSGILSFDCDVSTHRATCFCKDKAACTIPDCPDYCASEPDCGSYEFCSISGPTDYCRYGTGCAPGEQAQGTCCVLLGSPILIDVAGNGFSLSGPSDGVVFPLGPGAVPYRVSWTSPSSDDAWLVLDRNGNGKIDNGLELFGNFTDQGTPPPGEVENGFLALSEFDRPASGGNQDGQISADDRIFGSLRLWQDRNHDGVSTPDELIGLQAGGVQSLDLQYRLSRRTDRFGNGFRFRAKVRLPQDQWAVDVMLVSTRTR